MKALYKLRFGDVTELRAVLCTRLLGVLNKSNSLWYGEACIHYSDVIMSTMASQITSLTIVYPTIYSGVDQRQHQSYASLAFVRGIHQWPMNSQHKGPVTLKMFPFDDVSNSPMYRLQWLHRCFLSRLFWCRSKKISKLRVTGLCAGNSPGTDEFPAQRASNAENVSIWWRQQFASVQGNH